MISTDKSGVACCGNCGGHVVVACESGCAEPDVQFRDNYIATLKKPSGVAPREKTGTPRPASGATCNWPSGCSDPVAPPPAGRGRQSTKCPRHLAVTRRYLENYRLKKAAR